MLVEECVKADVDVVERAERAEVIEAAFAQRAPKALHFAARLRVVGSGVQERDAEPLAEQAQDVAAIGRAIVEIERVGPREAPQRVREELEHVGFALGGDRANGDDIAGGVVENGVDAHGQFALADTERGAVANVGVPQGAGAVGLPAQSGLGRRAVPQRDAVQALGTIQAAHAGLVDGAGLHAPVFDERAQDERHAGAGMLAADIAE